MTDTKVSTTVWTPAGEVSKGDILAQAVLELKAAGKIPQATLPSPELVSAKKTKRDDVAGTLFTVEVSFVKPDPKHGTVTIEDIVADLQPEPFDPADHNDET